MNPTTTILSLNKLPLFIGMLLVFLITSCNNEIKTREEQEIGAVKVELTDVVEMNLARPINTSGILSAKEEAKLSFKIGGIVKQVYAQEGQEVAKGTLLAQLDQIEIESKLLQAKSAHQKAIRDQKRTNELFKDSAATLEQLQDVKTQLELASSDLRIAEFNYKHSSIIAPSDGKILRRLAEENELVAQGMPVFLFGSTELNTIIRVGLTEKDILKVQIGDTAQVSFDAYPNEVYFAQVNEVAAAIDRASGTYEVELSMIDSSQTLLTGFTASVTISPRVKQKYTLVPMSSVIEPDGNNGFVFAVNEESNLATKIPVSIAFIFEDMVALRDPITNVKQIVSAGADYLYENAPVEVKEP